MRMGLDDFGGGIDRGDNNPEEDVKIELSQWLDARNLTVYWEKKHRETHSHSTFRVKGRRKPDLFIDGPSSNYAVEVKVGEESSPVHDGCAQTYQYWKDIVDGSASYIVNGKEKELDAVLLATKYAKEGRLFNDVDQRDPLRTGRDPGGREEAVKIEALPKNEHTCTETAVRLMWRFSKEYDDDAEVGIGSLLSSKLDGDDPTNSDPYALYKCHGSVNGKGNRYQEWDAVPFYLHDG